MVIPQSSLLRIECTLKNDAQMGGNNPATLALVQLCLGDYKLGTLDELTYLPSFKAGLLRMLKASLLDERDQSLALPDQCSAMLFSEEIEGQYLLSFGETFDDFLILAFRVGDNLIITWRILENSFFNYPELEVGVPYWFAIPLMEAEAQVYTFVNLY